MSELKRKLIETEAQMTRILKAMEAVQEKVTTISSEATTDDYKIGAEEQRIASNKVGLSTLFQIGLT